MGNMKLIFSNFIWSFIKFKATKNDKYLKKCIINLYDEYDQITFNYLKEVFLNYKMDFSITPNFKLTDFKKISITVICSNSDYLVPADKITATYNTINKIFKEIIVLNDTKHVASNKKLKKVIEQINV